MNFLATIFVTDTSLDISRDPAAAAQVQSWTALCFGSRSSTCINTLTVANFTCLVTKGLEPPRDKTCEIYGRVNVTCDKLLAVIAKYDRVVMKLAAHVQNVAKNLITWQLHH